MEIQEFEEENEAPVASTSAAKTPPVSVSSPAESKSNAPSMHTNVFESEPLPKTIAPSKAKKSVSFEPEDSYEPSKALPESPDIDESSLPVIASREAAASAGLSREKVAHTSEVQGTNNPLQSSFPDLTIKPSIVVRDTTKPPPVLTAAERSANRKSKYDVAAEYDGAEPKKVDLSAYLPRSLRGTPIAASFKGKSRAMEEDPATANESTASEHINGDDEHDYDDLEDSDDPDYLDDDDFDDDSDDDNTHIDDILAMREAAMEYHAKRHALGAGAGTGPLGGPGRPDEFDEVRGTLADRPIIGLLLLTEPSKHFLMAAWPYRI